MRLHVEAEVKAAFRRPLQGPLDSVEVTHATLRFLTRAVEMKKPSTALKVGVEVRMEDSDFVVGGLERAVVTSIVRTTLANNKSVNKKIKAERARCSQLAGAILRAEIKRFGRRTGTALA